MSKKQKIPVLDLNQLIEDCIGGKRTSQSQLYKLYASKMFTVCLRYCRNREEAEETLQEGFVKVFENLTGFKFAGSFEGWIRKIMVNCALQKYRSKSNLHAVIPIEDIPLEGVSHDDIVAQLGTKELLQLVQNLPATYRLVFNLYVFEGMKHREIAELLDISEGTSKSNLFDARALLQKAVAASMKTRNTNINYL